MLSDPIQTQLIHTPRGPEVEWVGVGVGVRRVRGACFDMLTATKGSDMPIILPHKVLPQVIKCITELTRDVCV